MNQDFLVYEHWRPDTGKCFYVGKGKRKRARSLEPRNSRHGRIVMKLARLGLAPEIRIVRSGLTESEAFSLEVMTITHWRNAGIEIANYTTGGDGPSGYVHTDATKAILRKLALGRKWSPETHLKRSQPRGPISEATRAKQSASAKIAQKARFDRMKQTKSGRLELKRRMLAMSRKAATSVATRALRSANAKALWVDPAYQAKMKNRRSRSIVKGFS